MASALVRLDETGKDWLLAYLCGLRAGRVLFWGSLLARLDVSCDFCWREKERVRPNVLTTRSRVHWSCASRLEIEKIEKMEKKENNKNYVRKKEKEVKIK